MQNLEIWRLGVFASDSQHLWRINNIEEQRKCHEFACACKKRAREPRYMYILCGRLSNEALIANIDRAAFATCTRTTEVSEGLADSRDRISGGPGARHENEWLPYVTRRKPEYEISRLCVYNISTIDCKNFGSLGEIRENCKSLANLRLRI